MIVTKDEYKRMMEICKNPPPPNERLKSMYREYKRKIANGELIVEESNLKSLFSC